MVNGIDEKKLQKRGNIKIFNFGCNHLMLIVAKRLDYFILLVETNDVTTRKSRKIIDALLMLKCNILRG